MQTYRYKQNGVMLNPARTVQPRSRYTRQLPFELSLPTARRLAGL
jgi:hypothetical protein